MDALSVAQCFKAFHVDRIEDRFSYITVVMQGQKDFQGQEILNDCWILKQNIHENIK